jgi:hypothetical protein
MGGKPLYMKIELTRRQAETLLLYYDPEYGGDFSAKDYEALGDVWSKIKKKLDATQE